MNLSQQKGWWLWRQLSASALRSANGTSACGSPASSGVETVFSGGQRIQKALPAITR